MPEAALLIEVVEAEALVHEWRRAHDPVATRGIPGHVTVLFPFVPPNAFDGEVLAAVAAVLEDVSCFDYDLVAVDEFPGVIWLRPEPDAPFRDLTHRVHTEFPEWPPYAGRVPDPQPHLTLAMIEHGGRQAQLAERIRADLDPHLPVRCSAREVSVFMSNSAGTWHRAHRLPLGR